MPRSIIVYFKLIGVNTDNTNEIIQETNNEIEIYKKFNENLGKYCDLILEKITIVTTDVKRSKKNEVKNEKIL